MHSNRGRYLLSGVFLRKLLKSRCGCCFRVLPERILAHGWIFLQSWKYRCFFYGRNCNSFVVLRADVFETLVAWTSRFLVQFPSALHFLPGVMYSSDTVVFSLLTKFVYLEVVILERGTEIFCDIFQLILIWHTGALQTDAVEQCTWVEACCHVLHDTHLPATNSIIRSQVRCRW
jgi:hypothetical protein